MPDRDATVFLLSFLGGSGRGWAGVMDRLPPSVRAVPVDLPGFGDAAAVPGYTVAAMAEHVAGRVRDVAPGRWFVAGHSMGAKVAAVLARRAEDGGTGLHGLAGLVLLAGSPPAPEPMDEDRRRDMLGWFAGGDAERRAQAAHFIDANTGRTLAADVRTRLVDDVLRTDRRAWVAWLQDGSREDWSGRIGTLQTPALILAGAEDADLGPDAQRTHTVPHFARCRVEVLQGARHLLPSEMPDVVASRIAAFAGAPAAIDPDYAALIASPRVSGKLRDALHARGAADDPFYEPRVLDGAGLATLRAVVAQVVPGVGIGLAARLDEELAEGLGDGWRFADLPPDPEAMRAALRTLDHAAGGFAAADGTRQHALLVAVAAGQGGAKGAGLLDGTQMQRWFRDLCAGLARRTVAHSATLARMGYSGIGVGGDAERPGYVQVCEREAWEPVAAGDRA